MKDEKMKNSLMRYLDKDTARGIMKTIILNYIERSNTYPYALLKHMKKHNGPMAKYFSKSDIYNMTSVLEKEGYIKSRKRMEGKKMQKLYAITVKGKTVIKNRDMLIKKMAVEMKKMLKEEFDE